MSDLKPHWNTLPCTRCMRRKGLDAKAANRRASNYYCKPCNAEYQRERYQSRAEMTAMKPVDLATITMEVENLKKLVNGPPFWLDEELMDEFNATILYLDSALTTLKSVVNRRMEEVKPGRPRKTVTDWETDTDLLDLRQMIAERERSGGKSGSSTIPYFQKRLREKGYEGPELDYEL